MSSLPPCYEDLKGGARSTAFRDDESYGRGKRGGAFARLNPHATSNNVRVRPRAPPRPAPPRTRYVNELERTAGTTDGTLLGSLSAARLGEVCAQGVLP